MWAWLWRRRSAMTTREPMAAPASWQAASRLPRTERCRNSQLLSPPRPSLGVLTSSASFRFSVSTCSMVGLLAILAARGTSSSSSSSSSDEAITLLRFFPDGAGGAAVLVNLAFLV